MTVTHHPSDETLATYTAATLGEGPSLVVGVHLAVCAACRNRIEAFEAIGGALLESLEPATMKPDAFATVLRQIDAPENRKPRDAAADRIAEIAPGVPLPEALRGYEIGPWRFLAPGLKFSRVKVSLSDKSMSKVLLLRATPGTYLPEHGHHGSEYICVLTGSFADQTGRYGPGDLAEADDALDHKPRAGPEAACICLVALDGGLRLCSLVGRILQPVFGL